MDKKIHEGRNIKRFREMMGLKQEALAAELGDDWNQKKISMLETKETVDLAVLQQVSKALNIPVEAFQNFDEEQGINNIVANTFENCNQPASVFYNSTINSLEEFRKLHDEKMALYERMLREKDEMMARLEKLIEKK
ncbi:MAG TPA: helix-turn-helix transcriptional regulator [Flavipsychrobacter sp.]|nr:helix-turn-helix transcriptional regulator [Flavipsychrobacter sp.]